MGWAALLPFVCCCGFAVRIVWWSSNVLMFYVLLFMSLKSFLLFAKGFLAVTPLFPF
jgi:hypothetical protein